MTRGHSVRPLGTKSALKYRVLGTIFKLTYSGIRRDPAKFQSTNPDDSRSLVGLGLILLVNFPLILQRTRRLQLVTSLCETQPSVGKRCWVRACKRTMMTASSISSFSWLLGHDIGPIDTVPTLAEVQSESATKTQQWGRRRKIG